jgi:hypothetical protein
MRQVVKKYPRSFLLISLVLCSAIAFSWCGRYTVTSANKYDPFSGVSYGYQIEQYYVWNTSRITIWNTRGFSYQMNAVYEFRQLTVENVVEAKWLKNNLAVYLDLDIKYHDSVASVHRVRMIYDFHRGEMHTSSGLTLWRIWNKENDSKSWMNDAEFDAVLNSLGG